jgi:hypothetical protein
LRGRSRPGTPGTPDSSRPSTGGGSAGGRRSLFRKKSRARRGGIVSRFPTITVVCGSDDGALCVYDFTAAVADLLQGLDHHSWHMCVDAAIPLFTLSQVASPHFLAFVHGAPCPYYPSPSNFHCVTFASSHHSPCVPLVLCRPCPVLSHAAPCYMPLAICPLLYNTPLCRDVPHGDDYNPYRHGLGKFVRKFEYARALWPQPTAPKVRASYLHPYEAPT